MSLPEYKTVYTEWLAAKQAEKEAQERRRVLEDTMTAFFSLQPDLDGTVNFTMGPFAVKVTGRLNFKVDGETLRDLAAEAGLENHLDSLFRWKPEINLTAWKQTAQEITSKLNGAITVTPGRPSYQITVNQDKE